MVGSGIEVKDPYISMSASAPAIDKESGCNLKRFRWGHVNYKYDAAGNRTQLCYPNTISTFLHHNGSSITTALQVFR